jgi:hypothetical protein
MALAKQLNWYEDRNAFLKRDELLKEDRLIQASAATILKKEKLRQEAKKVLNG